MNAKEARRLHDLFNVQPNQPADHFLLFREVAKVFKDVADRLQLEEEFDSLEDFTN